MLDERVEAIDATPPEVPVVETHTAAVHASERVMAAIAREAWDEFEQLFAPADSVESRRKIVGFKPTEFAPDEVMRQTRRDLETGIMRVNHVVIAVRGERLALARMTLGTADVSPGAPQDEFLQLYGVDEEGRIALQIWFDLEDMDAAIAEIDATYARFEKARRKARRPENAASRLYERFKVCFAARDWGAIAEMNSENLLSEDRRRVVNSGLQHGPDALIAELSAIAEVGIDLTSDVVATRGAHLVLSRVQGSGQGQGPDAFYVATVDVIEVDADERAVARIVFDLDDFDAAVAELDARYIAGEAAAHAQTWSVIVRAYWSLIRHELPPTTPNWVNLDHRRGIAFEDGAFTAYLRDILGREQLITNYIEAVHRLNNLGAVFTQVLNLSSQEGFDAEWRIVALMTVEGDLVSRAELFDEADLDTAIAKFEQLSCPAPRPENTASQIGERFVAYFAAGDWDAMATILADNFSNDDRRRLVGSGVTHGRDAQMATMRTIAEIFSTNVTTNVTAIRGRNLALARLTFSVRDEGPDAFLAETYGIVEINGDEKIASVTLFDLDDLEAAIAELDARYLAGEAAPYRQPWSVIAAGYATLRRWKLPATTPDFVSIDHRRVPAFAPGELIEYLRAGWDLGHDPKSYVEAVHRLSDLGAVVTHTAYATSPEGFDAEWRRISLLMTRGDAFSRSEIFDEADLDTAIAKFEQLSRPAPRFENAAHQTADRFLAYFAARDWDAMAEILAGNLFNDDRRRVVNAGVFDGRDAQMANARVVAELWSANVTRSVVATRGRNQFLGRITLSGDDEGVEAFLADMLVVVEIDADELISAIVLFDLDDLDAAIAELDARYVAGEAAAHSETWLVIAEVYAAVNRREIPVTTPDLVDIDHRSLAAIGSGDLKAYLQAAWKDSHRHGIYVETVHRLTDLGAVITHVAKATSREGFDAEWRITSLLTVGGDLMNRYEIFDAADLEAALARFDELHRQPPRFENTAAQAYERIQAHFAARDWDAVAEALADGAFHDDRRRVVGAGLRRGRDAVVAEFAALAEIGVKRITFDTVAIRGGRLVLSRSRASGRDPRADAFRTEVLSIAELDADGRTTALITFDPDDFDAAFDELDARYLAGEAAVHGPTWSVITAGYAALKRHEVPPSAPDYVNIDHRLRITSEALDLGENLRTAWDLTPNIEGYIEGVHRLSRLGAVVTYVSHGTSREGLDAEWRVVHVLTLEGDQINRCEVFDEPDFDTALARFDELQPQAPRLENAASQAAERFQAHFAARDWDAIADMLTADLYSDDRRPVVGGGIRPGRDALIEDLRAVTDVEITNATSDAIATRGGRLALARARYSRGHGEPDPFHVDFLQLVEIDAGDRITAFIAFDANDIDAAFGELDARYLAGEAAAHAHVWTAAAQVQAAYNRHEIPPTTADYVGIDHRRVRSFAPGDAIPYLRATYDVAPNVKVHIEAVHRLNNLGVVITGMVSGTSDQGFAFELREVGLIAFKGGLVSRFEMFDETDLDAALARFEELQSPTPRRDPGL